MLHTLRSLNLHPKKNQSIDAFFSEKDKNSNFLNLLDLLSIEEIPFSQLSETNTPNTSPLIFCIEPNFKSSEIKLERIADDIIYKPLTYELFSMLINFWSSSNPIFSDISLKKLASSKGIEIVVKVLNSFNETLAKSDTELNLFLKEKDLPKLSTLAHSLKTSALIVGALALVDLCEWIEFKNRIQSPLSEKSCSHIKVIFTNTRQYFRELNKLSIANLISK